MMFFEIFKKSFGLDFRSMSLYRVLLGLIIMVGTLYRMQDIEAFYTDNGILPRVTFLSELALPWSFSFHTANGSYAVMFAFFSIQVLLGLCVLLGFKTRWALIFSYIFNVSVHNRNWLINNGGDDVLRVILFLSIFLPLDKYFSVDKARSPEETLPKNYYTSPWTLAFFVQVFAIYFVSYILKDHPIWRGQYDAVYYALRVDALVNPIGFMIRDWNWFLKGSTIYTIFLEWLGPLLLVFSFIFMKYWWVARLLVVLGFWGLHMGIITTMFIGVFPYTCLALWSLFLPGEVWDYLASKFKKKSVTIYYDENCTFCFKMVRLIRTFMLIDGELKTTQSDPKVLSVMEKENSWVVINEEGTCFTRFEAFLEVLKNSPLFSIFHRLFASGLISSIGTRIYVWVSHNRRLMGQISQFLILLPPKKPVKILRAISYLLGTFICVTLIMWNLTTIKKFQFKAPFFAHVTRWLHLYQEWNMFSPHPKTDSVWLEIPAVLEDDSEVELLTHDRDIYSVKNMAFVKSIPSEHWRKFYLNISDRIDYGRYFAGYLCRSWNNLGKGFVPNRKLKKFDINVYSQLNLLNNERGGIVKKGTWSHWCYGKEEQIQK